MKLVHLSNQIMHKKNKIQIIISQIIRIITGIRTDQSTEIIAQIKTKKCVSSAIKKGHISSDCRNNHYSNNNRNNQSNSSNNRNSTWTGNKYQNSNNNNANNYSNKQNSTGAKKIIRNRINRIRIAQIRITFKTTIPT